MKKNENNVLKVIFDEPYFTYAKIIRSSVVKMYNLKLTTDLESIEILNNTDELFTVIVFERAFKRWQKIGKLPLTESEKEPVKFCKKEIGKEEYFIYQYENDEYLPCTKNECMKYEPILIWYAESIEERIRDYFAGRKNVFIEHYKIKD